MDTTWDCIIVGGGSAGLSAALVLGRARRRTLVIDAGRQSNLPAHAIGGLLAQEGTAPADLYATAREQLAGLPSVELRAGTVEGAEVLAEASGGIGAGDGGPGGVSGGGAAGASRGGSARFAVSLGDGSRVTARRLLLATGTDYVPPQLPGLAELWGGDVFHCPFCHGWEVRERPLGALGDGHVALHMGTLLPAWSEDVIVLSDGPSALDRDGRATLEALGVALDERPVERLRARDGRLQAVVFADGSELPRSGLMVAAEQTPRTALAAQLGAALDGRGGVEVDGFARTSVNGLFSAGDAVGPSQVAGAIGTGSFAGVCVVQSLQFERSGLPWPPPMP